MIMTEIEEKLENIEKEITELKTIILKSGKPKKKVSLKGILKGVKIEEEDMLEAKQSIFKTGV